MSRRCIENVPGYLNNGFSRRKWRQFSFQILTEKNVCYYFRTGSNYDRGKIRGPVNRCKPSWTAIDPSVRLSWILSTSAFILADEKYLIRLSNLKYSVIMLMCIFMVGTIANVYL